MMILIARATAARASDIADIKQLSERSSLTKNVVEPQFGGLDLLLKDFGNADVMKAFSVCRDDDGALAGWACCVRFHERVGYAGTACFVIDAQADLISSDASDELLQHCLNQLKTSCVKRLVAFSHSRTVGLGEWYERNGFRSAGSLPLRDGECLSAYIR